VKPLPDVRILVVEDDEDARELIGAALAAQGAATTCVAGAREALEEIQRSAPAVVISDINMPGEDGHAFLRKVRALPRDQGGRIPAVALTAMTSREDRIASRQAGFHYHLDKPVDTDKLVEIVLSLARLRR
jgi:CheY-like chemotaxis protein